MSTTNTGDSYFHYCSRGFVLLSGALPEKISTYWRTAKISLAQSPINLDPTFDFLLAASRYHVRDGEDNERICLLALAHTTPEKISRVEKHMEETMERYDLSEVDVLVRYGCAWFGAAREDRPDIADDPVNHHWTYEVKPGSSLGVRGPAHSGSLGGWLSENKSITTGM